MQYRCCPQNRVLLVWKVFLSSCFRVSLYECVPGAGGLKKRSLESFGDVGVHVGNIMTQSVMKSKYTELISINAIMSSLFGTGLGDGCRKSKCRDMETV